ncbi:MAG: T9SS C-terminal target domain-containing protein [Bacteroidetes bacterium]|nr:MAG: T9SS C-terminal target domain-containing protein [Bacteroidota bacterium]MBL1143736.1 T9SS C-terminal target domain-containing protein [Bacteroidota bacterium]NOG56538.1 T9SS type A sorting domain-containing protein [Bacteroidota bacterium]
MKIAQNLLFVLSTFIMWSYTTPLFSQGTIGCNFLSSNCNEILTNPTFNYFKQGSTSSYDFNDLCSWDVAFGNPILKLDQSNYYSTLESNKSAIISNALFKPTNLYKLNFDFKNANQPILNIPTPFPLNKCTLKVWIINNSTLNGISKNLNAFKTIASNLYDEVVSEEFNNYNKTNFQQFSYCFQPTQQFDRIVFLVESKNVTLVFHKEEVGIDNINLQELDVSLGNDIYGGCIGMGYVFGPICVNNDATYLWTPANKVAGANTANTGETLNQGEVETFELTATFRNLQCPSIKDQITVDKLEINAGSDITIGCNSNTFTLGPTRVRQGSKYVWTPTTGLNNANSPNPTVNPNLLNQTTKYTLKVDNCKETDEVTVYLLEADAGPDITSNCAVKIGPSVIMPGATFSWSPASFFDNPNEPNPIFYRKGVSVCTLTVSMRLPNNTICSKTDFVTITNTGGKTYDYIIPDNYTSQQVIQNLNNNSSTINGKSVLIKGSFVINQDLNFSNCNIDIAEHTKINITSAELKIINNSYVKSCNTNKFWDGIYLDRHLNSKLNIQNSDIQNADNGIVSYNGGSIILNGVNFDRNNRSVTVNANHGFAYTSNYFSEIVNCTFGCSSLLLINGHGKMPDYSIKIDNWSLIGLSNNNGFQIGKKSASPNIFYGSGGKVILHESSVNIENSIFEGFNKQGNFLNQDVAIEITGEHNGNTQGKRIDISSCWFLENKNSIHCERLNSASLFVKENKYNIDRQSIIHPRVLSSSFVTMKSCANSFLDAAKNEIYNVNRGFLVFDVHKINIVNNQIDMEYQANSGYSQTNNTGSAGVYINNLMADPMGAGKIYRVKIKKNTISHARVGIWAEHTQALIDDNTILDLNTVTQLSSCDFCITEEVFGIKAFNDVVRVENNKVLLDPNNYLNINLTSNSTIKGISIANTSWLLNQRSPFVSCNVVKNTGVGFHFAGNNSSNTYFWYNSMENHYDGLALTNKAIIGNIGSRGNASQNLWKGAYSRSHVYTSNNTVGSNCTIYCLRGLPFEPIANFNDKSSSRVIVNAEGNDGTSMDCENWLYEFYGYEPEGGNEEANQNNYINKTERSATLDKQEMTILDKQFFEYEQITASENYNPSQIADYIFDLSREFNYKEALKINSSQESELKFKGLFKKYINYLKIEEGEVNLLIDISKSCPFDFGMLVYISRRILTDLGYKYEQSICETIDEKSSNQATKKQKFLDFSNQIINVYPNPAKEKITIEQSVPQEDLKIKLLDLTGKVVFQKRLTPIYRQDLNLNPEIKIGLYLYQIINIVDGSIVKSEKLGVR